VPDLSDRKKFYGRATAVLRQEFAYFRGVYSRVWVQGISTREALVLCLIIAFGLYSHLLIQRTFNGGDFPPAAGYALQFKLAVLDGQWLPRWIVVPREFTFGGGSVDGTTPTAGSPAFLYYGFLQSALSLPLLFLRASAAAAPQLVVCLAFGFGAWAMYVAARALKAGPVAALVSAYAYIVSPWLLSNFYHRGGISEALSHAALPFLLLGFVWISVGRVRAAVLILALGSAWLALCHNIFLMLGVGLCGLFGVFYFGANCLRRNVSWWERLRPSLLVGVGVGIGILLTAWQWVPAFFTLNEISFEYIGNLRSSWIAPLSNLSGAYGLPRRLAIKEGVTDFYTTIGWWTIPAAICLLIQRKDRPLGWALFGCFAVFFVLTFDPQQLTGMLPAQFGIVQFSFRMLAFLSLLGTLGIAMAFPRLRWPAGLTLVVLMTASQFQVFPHRIMKRSMTDEAFLGGYEYNAYYANSRNEKNLRYWYNGWLQPDNVITFDQDEGQPAFLRIRGILNPKISPTARLYLGELAHSEPTKNAELGPARTEVVNVSEKFDVTLKVDHPAQLRLYTIPSDPLEFMKPQMVSLIKGPPSSYVFADDVERTDRDGYRWTFRVLPSLLRAKTPDAKGLYTVELPMIYNRFSVPYQGGAKVPYESDFNHRILIRVPNLTEPIIVAYEQPWQASVLTWLGLMAVLVVVAGSDPMRLVGFRRSNSKA
jgi:hypothetical protein